MEQGEECLACEYPCKACSEEVGKCYGCEDGFMWLVEESLCLKTCPAGTFIQAGTQCEPCAATCKTCTNHADFCTSCHLVDENA